MSQVRSTSLQNLTEQQRREFGRKGKRNSPWSKGPIVRTPENQRRHAEMYGECEDKA